MYKAALHLVPWPKGSAFLSEVGESWRTVDLTSSRSDSEAIREAEKRASTLKGSLALKSCEVIRIFEITEREVPLN